MHIKRRRRKPAETVLSHSTRVSGTIINFCLSVRESRVRKALASLDSGHSKLPQMFTQHSSHIILCLHKVVCHLAGETLCSSSIAINFPEHKPPVRACVFGKRSARANSVPTNGRVYRYRRDFSCPCSLVLRLRVSDTKLRVFGPLCSRNRRKSIALGNPSLACEAKAGATVFSRGLKFQVR